MILLRIIIIAIAFAIIGRVVYKFIKDNITYKRTMKNIRIWGDFNKQLIQWSNEITDPFVKIEFTNECVSKLTNNYSKDHVHNFDLEKEKLKVFEKWGSHIPSLKSEYREKRLKSLGI